MPIELVPELGLGRLWEEVSCDAPQPVFYTRHGFAKLKAIEEKKKDEVQGPSKTTFGPRLRS
jgi:hypothetical protein